MKEIEAKIELEENEFNRIKKQLGSPRLFNQHNWILPLKNGFLRIRREKSETILTFKSEREEKKLNEREEIETRVDNPKILDILNNLDLIFYKKRRANIKFNNCVVSLDILKNKFYIEIEGRQRDILRVISLLGLEKYQIETKSYLELLYEIRREENGKETA